MSSANRPRHLRAVALTSFAVAALSASAFLVTHATAESPQAYSPAVTGLSVADPSVEVVSDGRTGAVLAFKADDDSRDGLASVFVRVPDTGRIEWEIGALELSSSGPELDASLCFEVSEPAIMRDLRVVRVDFSPAPGSGDLYVRSAELTLRAVAGTGINEKIKPRRPFSPTFHHLYESTVINYDAEEALAAAEQQAARGSRDPLPYGAQYLVISVNAFTDEIYPLVKWKNAKGVRSMLVNLSTTGASEPEIRAYIQNAYDTWEVPPEFVLLVGDTETLPGYESLTYTDNYYATVEGSDYLADIMIGRISADYGSQVSTQVAKIFGYERTPLENDPNWPMSASLWVHDDFDSGDWIYYMNTWRIYDDMIAHGFSPVDTLFHRNGISRNQVYASVNEGKGFLNFRGQAWINWLSPFDLNPDYTSNGWRLPIVVSATCGTGNYEHDGFICEGWVRTGSATNPRGAVAFFATNTAFAGSEELSLRRGYVDEGFFDGVFADSALTLGEACLAGKMRLYLKAEDQIDYEGWNLLGDPEMSMWTGEPFGFSVLHDAGTQVGQSDFSVTVVSGGSLYEGALVALSKGDEVHTTGLTDALGHVSLAINPATPGTLAVVVTDRNAIPYEGQALVLESGPFVVYSDVNAADAAAGNGDGHLNTGETSDLEVALTNIGDVGATSVTAHLRCGDANMTVIDSIAVYGDLAPDAMSWGLDSFEVSIASGCANGTLIPYSVAVFIDGEQDLLLNPAPLEVVTAEMVHTGTLCEDESPGGNGDGSPGAGETVGLVFSLTNLGLSELKDVEATLSTTDQRFSVTNPAAPFGDAPAGATVENGEVSFIASVSPTATSGHIVPLSLHVTGDGYSYQYSETLEFNIVLVGASVAAPLGPDSYGYYAYDRADSAYGPAPGYDWFDIAPPGPGNLISAITDEDAGVTTMGIFLPLRYYGTTYDLMSINSNGFLSPGTTDYRFGDNSPIPDVHGPPNMIAPFWDDLDPSAGGDIYVWMDIANHRLIYQFDEVPIWGTSNTQTFQVILYDEAYYPTPTNDTQIKFQYESVSMPYGCTVGIENYMQDDGIQWLNDAVYSPHAAPIEAGAAILFTTVPPSDPDVTWLVLTDSSLDDSAGGNGDGVASIGETVELTLEFSSVGGTSAEDVSVALTSGESMLTVVDGTASVPNIPADGSRWSTDPLSFVVNETVGDTVATLWAEVTANGGAYTGAGRVDVRIDLSATGVDDAAQLVFGLKAGYPNPFARDTRLQLTLPAPQRVVANVYSPSGRLVKTLVDARLDAGEHPVRWDGTDSTGHRVASGVYFVRLDAGANRASRKVVLLK